MGPVNYSNKGPKSTRATLSKNRNGQMVVFKLEICTQRLTNLCLNSLSIAIARGSGLRKLANSNILSRGMGLVNTWSLRRSLLGNGVLVSTEVQSMLSIVNKT